MTAISRKSGLLRRAVGEAGGDFGVPEVLVFDVDQAVGAGDDFLVGAGDAAFAVGRERVTRPAVRIGPQYLDGVCADGRRVGQRRGKDAAVVVVVAEQVREQVDGIARQRGWIVPAFPEAGLDVGDGGALDRELDVMPGRARTVPGGHRLCLGITFVAGVVGSAVAQVDSADERNVTLRTARVAEHDELLVMRAAGTNPHVA